MQIGRETPGFLAIGPVNLLIERKKTRFILQHEEHTQLISIKWFFM